MDEGSIKKIVNDIGALLTQAKTFLEDTSGAIGDIGQEAKAGFLAF